MFRATSTRVPDAGGRGATDGAAAITGGGAGVAPGGCTAVDACPMADNAPGDSDGRFEAWGGWDGRTGREGGGG